MFVTAGTCIGLLLYTLNTKKELTYFLGLSASIGGVYFFAMLWGLFVGFGPFMDLIYLLVGTCLYSLYLIMDIKMIIGGGRFEVSIDDYIRASMRVYMDVIILFMKILRLLEKMSNNEKGKK